MSHLGTILRSLWEYLREVSGENDYARYRQRVIKQGGQPLSRQAFYLKQQEDKNSRPTRCC